MAAWWTWRRRWMHQHDEGVPPLRPHRQSLLAHWDLLHYMVLVRGCSAIRLLSVKECLWSRHNEHYRHCGYPALLYNAGYTRGRKDLLKPRLSQATRVVTRNKGSLTFYRLMRCDYEFKFFKFLFKPFCCPWKPQNSTNILKKSRKFVNFFETLLSPSKLCEILDES